MSVIILEIGLNLGGFLFTTLKSYRNQKVIKQNSDITVLCLGESTTDNQWPPFFAEIMNSAGLGLQFKVIDKGEVGMTTDSILSRLDNYLDTYQPDIVITMMGVNDSFRKFAYGDNDFLNRFKTYKLLSLLRLHMKAKLNKEASPPRLNVFSVGELSRGEQSVQKEPSHYGNGLSFSKISFR